jgi:hypothetical protein
MEKGFLVRSPGVAYAPAGLHRWYALDDSASPGSTLEKRARSYLASNCSHCHSINGNASCIPIYSYLTPNAPMNYMNRASNGAWGVKVPAPDTAKWIFPGKPEYSVILRRISAADSEGYRDTSMWDYPGIKRPVIGSGALAKIAGWEGTGLVQMPPLATYEVNPLADRILYEWIKSLPTGYTGAALKTPSHSHAAPTLRLSDGFIFLPDPSGASAASSAAVKAELISLTGKRIALSASRPGVFRIPPGLESGVYLLRAGSVNALVNATFPE